MGEVLVLMEGIEKTFPGVHALKQCRFELRSGEVHALVGENGAGKSTLMKILTGVYTKDSGSIVYKGREVEIQNTRAAQDLGISIIFQEFNLMPHLTVAQNIFIGREPRKGVRFLLNEKEINEKTQQLLDLMNVDIDPRARVSELTVAKQQMVEIAKALSFNSEVLIMDEPTAALTETEIEDLFRIIRDLQKKGVGIIYISHRLEELSVISDRITVIRDGEYIDTVAIEDVTTEQIIKMMVGREIYETFEANTESNKNEVVLEVKNLNRGREVRNVSFKLRKGEILGFAGLMGAGRTEVARAVFGADPIDSGEVFVNGNRVNIRKPIDAVKHAISYLSEVRKQFGLMLDLSVELNTVIASLKNYANFIGWVNRNKTRKESCKWVDILQIKTPSLDQKVKNLSGGNQQKVVFGK